MTEKSYDLTVEERSKVRERYPQVVFPDPALEPVFWGRRTMELIPDRKAVVDLNSGNVFAVCSDRYKVVHYEDIIHMVEGVIPNLKRHGEIRLHPTIFSDGGKMKLTMHFPNAKTEIAKGDSIHPKVEVFSSYDLSYRLTGRFGAFQLRCTNGMGVWKFFNAFAKKHLFNLNLGDLESTIAEGLGIFGHQISSWREWSETKLNEPVYNSIWKELPFSPKEKEKIEVLPEIGTNRTIREALKKESLTLWQLNSILTQFTTHEVKSELRKIELEPEIARVLEISYNSMKH
jgi:hypothetical protein